MPTRRHEYLFCICGVQATHSHGGGICGACFAGNFCRYVAHFVVATVRHWVARFGDVDRQVNPEVMRKPCVCRLSVEQLQLVAHASM